MSGVRGLCHSSNFEWATCQIYDSFPANVTWAFCYADISYNTLTLFDPSYVQELNAGLTLVYSICTAEEDLNTGVYQTFMCLESAYPSIVATTYAPATTTSPLPTDALSYLAGFAPGAPSCASS